MAARRILLIQSGSSAFSELGAVLKFVDCEVIPAASVQLAEASQLDIDVVFVALDEATEPADLRWVDALANLPLIVVLGKGNVPAAWSNLQSRAAATVEWPCNYASLAACFERLTKASNESSLARNPELFRSLTGGSPAIQRTRKLIQQVAPSEATVLILGESGTGKEVIARNLHYYSQRRTKPFVPVNCGAIPSELLESELFGHEKGAFTGALSTRQGRFEMAEGGTLFLDEIGDMPLTMQVKLLRVLQERAFERVGSNKTIQCDVRIIAATHRNLENEIRQNRFREDLFYRLNVFPIEVPALRERVEDLPALIEDLSARLRAERRGELRLSSGALRLLQRYPWPGNVRELANLVERLVILYPNHTVEVCDLPEKLHQFVKPEDEPVLSDKRAALPISADIDAAALARLPQEGLDLREHLNTLECELIKQALDECDGVVAHAANLLRMRRTTLVEKLRKYGLRGEDTTII